MLPCAGDKGFQAFQRLVPGKPVEVELVIDPDRPPAQLAHPVDRKRPGLIVFIRKFITKGNIQLEPPNRPEKNLLFFGFDPGQLSWRGFAARRLYRLRFGMELSGIAHGSQKKFSVIVGLFPLRAKAQPSGPSRQTEPSATQPLESAKRTTLKFLRLLY